MLRKIPLLLILLLAACGTSRESPVIYLGNASLKPIRNIHCVWAEKHVLSLPILNPGESRSQSFYMKTDAEFFGLVRVSWTNDEGKDLTHEFFFRKNNLPNIDDHTTYNYVQLYFDQHYVETTTSDAPDLSGKAEKMDKLMVFYSTEYAKRHKDGNAPLINVQSQRNNNVPGSILNMY